MKWIDKINEKTGEFLSYLALVISLIVIYDILARWLFNSHTLWAQELSTMIFGAYIIMAGGYIHLRKGHVNMDLVYNKLNVRAKKLCRIFESIIILLFAAVLAWKGGEIGLRSLIYLEHSGSVWNPPLYFIKICLPIGAFLLFLQEISNFKRGNS